MKKKYRKAVCRCFSTAIQVITCPLEGVSYLCSLASEKLYDCADWLEDELRIYDPDYQPKEKK